MQTILQTLEKKTIPQLQFWIVLIAVLIAAQVQYIQHGWINPDSVLYLEAAKFFNNGDWKAGFEVFSWPFYSLCITLICKITHLNVHVSAQILNVFFFAIATYSYLKIIQLAGGKQRQIIAGALIWLSAQYMIGGVLEMLMRDEGFWAFYLLSIVLFIRFYQQHQLKDALIWQVCIILATLFRIEAILYLLFLPLILLFQTGFHPKQKWKHVIMANAMNIGVTTLIVAVFTFNDNISTKILGRLNEVFTNNLWQEFTQQLTEKSRIMSSQVLGQFLEEFAVQGLLMTFIYVIIVKTISATGLVSAMLSGLAIKQNKQLIQPVAFKVLRATAIITLINMALIITKVFVLTGRYVLALSFILMIFAAFYFAEMLFTKKANKKLKWLTIAIVVLMLGGAIKNILPKQQGYNYEQEAVAWLSKYNKENKPVFYQDARLRYYAKAPFIGSGEFSLDSDISNNDSYAFLVINDENKALLQKSKIAVNSSQYHAIKKFYAAKTKKSITVYEK